MRAKRGGRSPADVDGVHERVYEQRKAGRHGHGAGYVECPPLTLFAALGQYARRQEGAEETDRDVHEQHPAPVEAARQHASQQHAGGAARARDRAPHAERAIALLAVRERGRDDRQRRGRDDRGAHSL